MHKNIKPYEIQIENIINEFQSFLLDDCTYTGIYIELSSPEHSEYFINFIYKLNSQTIYSSISHQWYLRKPIETLWSSNPFFTLKIELEKR